MPLGDQRQSGAFALGELGQRVGQIRAVRDRTEVAARAGAEPVAELVDRPQVDARGVEREAVPVVDAGVLAEAMQEDDDGARFLGRPVPVVGPALRVIDERHAHDCISCDARAHAVHASLCRRFRTAVRREQSPRRRDCPIPANRRSIAATGIKP